MPPLMQSAVTNRLLSLMTASDFELLAPHLTPAHLPRGFVLAEPDQQIKDVYFPDSGVVSMVAVSPEGTEVEAGVIGREGFASTAPILWADSTPNRINAQIEGTAWRIERPAFAHVLDESSTLRELLSKFLQTLMVQTTYTALSNAVHTVDERLARWLLMCDDRMDEGEMALTHEFMSVMLAVRRPSVTTALHVLEGNGFIQARRGCVVIRNRTAMEQFAGDAYGRPEAAYRQLIGEMRPAV